MSNTWIVVPIIENSTDLTDFVASLSGGFVAPETYKKYELNEETKEHEYVDVPHPYFGQTPPSFADKIIFINTKNEYTVYPGVLHVEDFEDINIYRAWNSGIEAAIAAGADSILLLNTAIDFDLFIVNDAHTVMASETKEVVNISDGAMVLISATSSIRADEQFQIWYGDNDLYRVAEEVATGVRVPYFTLTDLISHTQDEAFISIVTSDEEKYNAKWN
jgi:hypothetical protein